MCYLKSEKKIETACMLKKKEERLIQLRYSYMMENNFIVSKKL